MISSWLLDGSEREALLRRFPPAYPDVVAHHVTLDADAPTALPAPARGEIVGEADDGEGVQALVVRIEGTTARPDGGAYHVTWSLDRARGREPVESNTVIAERGWRAVEPTGIALTPAWL